MCAEYREGLFGVDSLLEAMKSLSKKKISQAKKEVIETAITY